MKLTSFAIIFVIIISPFIFISAQEAETAIQDQKLRYYYDNIIDNATIDAAFILSNKGTGLTYAGNVKITDARQLAAEAFFDSVYHSFNAKGNPSLTVRVDACIPVLVFLESEGFTLYALDEYKNIDGQNEIKHIWFPMQHYIGEFLSDRFIIRYTLEDKVYVFDITDQTFREGDYREFEEEISYFKDEQTFENLRLAAVKNSVEEKIIAYMDYYNQWTLGRSFSVKLEFPSIDDADWKRAITDEGIIVFAQGFPVLSGKNYKHYALGGARVIRKASLTGYTYLGVLYYCRRDCEFLQNTVIADPEFNPDSMIYFSNAYEAAAEGYFPCPHCRP